MSSPVSTAPSAGSSLLSIEKLHASNYLSWKQRVRALLMHNKVWTVVTSAAPSADADAAAKVAWREKDEVALADITLTLADSQLGYIRHCQTAHEAWTKLASVHEQKTAAAMLYLRRRMTRTTLDQSIGGMQGHINSLRDMMDQLASMGSPISDVEAAILLSCSVPEQYESVVTILSMRPANELTFELVATCLLAEEKRREETAASTSATARAESAFAAASAPHGPLRGLGQDRRRNKANRPICEYCNKSGHTEAVCYSKHGHPDDHPRDTGSNASTFSGRAAAHASRLNIHQRGCRRVHRRRCGFNALISYRQRSARAATSSSSDAFPLGHDHGLRVADRLRRIATSLQHPRVVRRHQASHQHQGATRRQSRHLSSGSRPHQRGHSPEWPRPSRRVPRRTLRAEHRRQLTLCLQDDRVRPAAVLPQSTLHHQVPHWSHPRPRRQATWQQALLLSRPATAACCGLGKLAFVLPDGRHNSAESDCVREQQHRRRPEPADIQRSGSQLAARARAHGTPAPQSSPSTTVRQHGHRYRLDDTTSAD